MKWESLLLVLLSCLVLAPAIAQEESDPAQEEFEAKIAAWTKAHNEMLVAYWTAVSKSMGIENLAATGEEAVFEINTQLTTLKASASSRPLEPANTLAHEVSHTINDDSIDLLAEEAAWCVAWKLLLDLQTTDAARFAAGTPIKAEAVTKQLEWADQQLRGIRGRLSGSAKAEDLERELQTVSRVRTTLRNTSRALTALVDRGRKWIEEIEKSGESLSKDLQRVQRLQSAAKAAAASHYDPYVVEFLSRSVPLWIEAGEAALEANQSAREAAQEMFAPFDEETLLGGIPSFKDATFATLADVVEPHEKALRKLLAQQQRR